MGILQQIVSDKAWELFLANRLQKGRFSWSTFEEADEYVENRQYLQVAEYISSGGSLGIPVRKEINKIGTGKKRIVYCFSHDKMRILKLISFLLYKYDGLFAPNCYAFRQGKSASDAIRDINKTIRNKRLWAYKVDIHNYFNSISIPVLLPILSDVLKDDPELFAFLKQLLDDDSAYCGNVIIHEQRGVMAGLPIASFLANVYLMEVDHFFNESGILYARYSDDIIIFAEDEKRLNQYRSILLDFLRKYQLEINPAKEMIYSPDEPFEYLGFRCMERKIDISHATRDKFKGKIYRKARSIRRKCSKEGWNPEKGIKMLIRFANRKLFDVNDNESLCWSSWFFPVINVTDGLKEIDHYIQENCRYVYTGRHNKANYKTRYSDLKRLGYRSLLHEFYLGQKKKKSRMYN